MTPEGERLAVIESDVRWIRDTLEEADLVKRVTTLELQVGQVKAIVMAVPILLSVLTAAAKFTGVLP